MKKTQEERVLERLQQANGNWVHGRDVFLVQMMLTQYHRAIHALQNKKERYGYEGTVVASDFTDEFGFKSYKLSTNEPKQVTMFQ